MIVVFAPWEDAFDILENWAILRNIQKAEKNEHKIQESLEFAILNCEDFLWKRQKYIFLNP